MKHPIEKIAIACHEMNAMYCAYIGDHSQPGWDDAPEWQRESAIDGVRNVLNGTVTTPEQSHESWRRHKVEDGWNYGVEKDPEKKTHPCLVDYAELPAEQKAKDAIFFAVVEGMRG